MRILMLSTSYEGQRGPAEREAEALRAAGHSVDLVRLVQPRSRPGAGLAGRAPGLVRSWLSAAAAAASRGRYDRVEVETSPPLAFVPLALRTRLLGERLVLRHWDVFPENAAVAGLVGRGAALRALEVVAGAAARLADDHVTLSEEMAATLRPMLGGTPVRVEPLPAAEIARVAPRDNRWLEEAGLKGRRVVMYAGNFGMMYDFEPLLAAAREFEAGRGKALTLGPSPASGRGGAEGGGTTGGDGATGRPVAFAFVGAGSREGGIRAAAKRLSNVVVLPPVPEDRLAEVLSAGDVHVVPLVPGAGRVMWPSKVGPLRAMGKPILAVGWGEGVDGVRSVEPSALAGEIEDILEGMSLD